MEKIAIMVMAANAEPSTRNLEAIGDTLIKYYNDNKDRFKHEYDFYFYWCEPLIDEEVEMEDSDVYQNLKLIKVKEEESVYRTFEKTIKAFDLIEKNKYDWYVRMNISMWLNIDLLDAVIDQFNHNCIYGNALNSFVNLNSSYVDDLYVRGDLMIFDSTAMTGMLSQALKYMYSDINMKVRDGIDHVDDCLLGACFIDYAGANYYENLYMLSYTYLPDFNVDENLKPRMYHIGTRVKTVPPNETYSGYSWDDNEWRKKDVEKMHKLTNYIIEHPFDYKSIKMKDVLIDKAKARQTLFITASSQDVFKCFHKFLSEKRKVWQNA